MSCSRLYILLASLAVGSSSCSQAESPAPGDTPIFSTGPRSGGVTVLVATVGDGSWSDSPAACGTAHFNEHVAGRLVEARLKAQNLPFGYSVDGHTGPHESTLLISLGGGADGLAAGLKAIDSISLRQAPPELLAGERALIEAEQSLVSNGSASVAPLVASLSASDATRFLGNCLNENSLRASDTNLLRQLWVITEVPKAKASKIVSSTAPSPPAQGAASGLAQHVRVSDPTMPATAFLTSADTQTDSLIAGSLAAWISIARSSDMKRPPRFIPLGRLGYITVLERPLSVQQISEALLEPGPADEAQAAAAAAQAILCSKRPRAATSAHAVARTVAADPWARLATFGGRCDRDPELPSSQAKALVRAAAPLNPPRGPFPTSRDRPQPDGRLSLCGFEGDQLSRFRGYYTAVLNHLLVNALRFEKSNVLRVEPAADPDPGCIAFSTFGSIEPGALREQLAAIAREPDRLPGRITAAHRSQCLFLSAPQRTEIGDLECRAPAKPNTLSQIGRVLSSASISWKPNR